MEQRPPEPPTTAKSISATLGPQLGNPAMPPNNMSRGLSHESGRIYDTAVAQSGSGVDDDDSSAVLQGSPRALLLGLFAIKFAHRSKRLTDCEKFALRSSLARNAEADTTILSKLNESERTAISLARSPKASTKELTVHPNMYINDIVCLAELNVQERFELDSLRSKNATKIAGEDGTGKIAGGDKSCCICGEGNLTDDFLLSCKNKDGFHHVCSNCITGYVRSMNESIGGRSFLDRNGMVLCPEIGCNHPYPSGALCQRILEPDVAEEYIEGLQLFQKMNLVQEYTQQILMNLDEVRATATEAGEEAAAKLERQKVVADLQAMADNIRLTCPDAKQCGSCGWGPILMDNRCDDLTAHHGQVLNQRTGLRISNDCPNCHAFESNKHLLPAWDGKLPKSVTDGVADVDVIEAVTPANAFAELARDLNLTPSDLANESFRQSIERSLRRGCTPEVITELRRTLEHGRRNRLPFIREHRIPNHRQPRVPDWVGRPRVPCRYFNQAGTGCRNGDRCPFLHDRTLLNAQRPDEQRPRQQENRWGVRGDGWRARPGAIRDEGSPAALPPGFFRPTDVSALMEMGFERTAAISALHAANNDINRAVERLTSGL